MKAKVIFLAIALAGVLYLKFFVDFSQVFQIDADPPDQPTNEGR